MTTRSRASKDRIFSRGVCPACWDRRHDCDIRVHGFDLRRARSIGLEKTKLQHVLIASALNLVRMGAWLMETPRAQTRVSRFARLAPAQQKAT